MANEKMTRSDFITKLFSLYPKDFASEESKRNWFIAYDTILTKRFEVDFDKLLKKILLEHKSKTTAPAPALLEEFIYKCRVVKEVVTGDEIELQTKMGSYKFTKVGPEWDCKTIKQITEEVEGIGCII